MPNQLKMRIWNAKQLPPDWFKRDAALDESVENDVKAIISEVRKKGNLALAKFTLKFDKAKIIPKNLRVTPEETQAAYRKVTDEQVQALKLMKEKVSAFEKLFLKQRWIATSNEGITIKNIIFPIESVGCYVPGGQAAQRARVHGKEQHLCADRERPTGYLQPGAIEPGGGSPARR